MVDELSVLIPVFNQDVRPLVRTLHQQCQAAGLAFEILCIDDGSDPKFIQLNQQILSFSQTRYEVLSRHLGRVAIRNKLAQEARFPFLLFLDNDSRILQPDFITRYLQAADRAPVLLGGTCYQADRPSVAYRLRWKYGRQREEQPATRRNQAPYRSFYLNNIFLKKSLFLQFPLQPLLQPYGHEDSWFGRQLEQAGIAVLHLDNPVLHEGLEPAAVFLDKSCQATENLYWLYSWQGIGAETKLIRAYQLLERFGLQSLWLQAYRACAWIINRNLQGPWPSIWLFDLFKLYHFMLVARKQKSPVTQQSLSGKKYRI